jgi:enolase
MIIGNARALKTPDSRGEPTISIVLEAKAGKVLASAPSGKSRGKHEAAPFSEKGIDFSISFANAIAKKLISEKISFNSFEDLEKFETILGAYDKSENWNLIGGNTVFAFESAILKAIALNNKQELWQFLNEKAKNLPMPVGNCIGGGQHTKSERKSDFQEFLFIPKAKNFIDAFFINLQAYRNAKSLVIEKDKSWKGQLTDENAIAPSLSTEEILDIMDKVSEASFQKFGSDLRIGVDAAASTLFHDGKYHYLNPKSEKTSEKQIEFMQKLIKDNDLFYAEDPLQEDDFESFAKLTKKTKSLVVGDDLTCTQPSRLLEAIKHKSINAVIVKPNQNGSLLKTKEFVDIAKKHDITPIISHRSGETLDSTISDLAVAWNIPFIKTGILGKERFAKLNRLIKIEREISS